MSGRIFPYSRDERLSETVRARCTDDEREDLARFARNAKCGQATFFRRLLHMLELYERGEEPDGSERLGSDPWEYMAAMRRVLGRGAILGMPTDP